jgi:hypothetical protein
MILYLPLSITFICRYLIGDEASYVTDSEGTRNLICAATTLPVSPFLNT